MLVMFGCLVSGFFSYEGGICLPLFFIHKLGGKIPGNLSLKGNVTLNDYVFIHCRRS